MNKRKFFLVAVIFIGMILTGLSIYQSIQDKKSIKKEDLYPEGSIEIEKEIVKTPEISKKEEIEDVQSISVFYKKEDPALDENLLNFLYEYGEESFLFPSVWEENKKISPEEGVNKTPGYFDNPDLIQQRLREALSSAKKFEEFEAYQLSPNIDIAPIIMLKTLKKELSDEPKEMLRIANDFFMDYYPRTRLEKIEDIENFTVENIQPFEILINEKDIPFLEKKIKELSDGIGSYLKERYPASKTSEDGELFSFYLEDEICFPNGKIIPEGKKYMIVAGVLAFDERTDSFLRSRGFGTE